MDSRKKLKYLVADTTAFINAVQLNDYAENVLTVPDVIAEVRNRRQIRRLCVLPYDLQVREPRVESIRHCVEFAKKTGDYASLSGIDIKVVALTYELEVDNVGKSHLRAEPVVSQVIASKEKPEELKDTTKLAGWYNPTGNQDDSEDDEEDEGVSSNEDEDKEEKNSDEKAEIEEPLIDTVKVNIERCLAGEKLPKQPDMNLNEDDDVEISKEDLNKLMDQLKVGLKSDDDDGCNEFLVSQKDDDSQEEEDQSGEEIMGETQETEGDYNDDNGWITPSNIKKVKKSLEGKEVDTKITPTVACMSTDYAVQNVLKQINLNVAALDGRVIKHLRTYILRCYACFKTTSIMTKVFCPNCGNKTLKRVAVSLDENGKQVIHINTRRPLTRKYKNQSLPRFRGGKHSHNPIIFEDQPIPRQMPSRVARSKTNALEEDYVAGFSPFAMRDVDSKSAILRSKGHVKDLARNHTYEEDRRRKNYNRLYK